MNKKDFYCGIILFSLGLAIAWQASTFPVLAGMPYGPGLFPTIAASGLGLCGVLILISSLMSKCSVPAAEEPTEKNSRGYRPLLNGLGVIAVVIFYATLLQPVGFHLVSFLTLLFLFMLLQGRWIFSFLLASGVTTGVHLIFYSFLHVPLPWGILEPFAW